MTFKTTEEARIANARGRARQTELAGEAEAYVASMSAQLLAELGRKATASEEALAQLIATGLLKVKKLRGKGGDEVPIVREVTQMLRDWRLIRVTGRAAPSPATEPSV